MRTVRTMTQVIPSAWLRALPEIRQAKNRLRQAAEKRMDELLEGQLRCLAQCANESDFKALCGRYRTHEWPCLRGDFPTLVRKADLEARRLLHLLSKEAESSAGGECEHL